MKKRQPRHRKRIEQLSEIFSDIEFLRAWNLPDELRKKGLLQPNWRANSAPAASIVRQGLIALFETEYDHETAMAKASNVVFRIQALSRVLAQFETQLQRAGIVRSAVGGALYMHWSLTRAAATHPIQRADRGGFEFAPGFFERVRYIAENEPAPESLEGFPYFDLP